MPIASAAASPRLFGQPLARDHVRRRRVTHGRTHSRAVSRRGRCALRKAAPVRRPAAGAGRRVNPVFNSLERDWRDARDLPPDIPLRCRAGEGRAAPAADIGTMIPDPFRDIGPAHRRSLMTGLPARPAVRRPAAGRPLLRVRFGRKPVARRRLMAIASVHSQTPLKLENVALQSRWPRDGFISRSATTASRSATTSASSASKPARLKAGPAVPSRDAAGNRTGPLITDSILQPVDPRLEPLRHIIIRSSGTLSNQEHTIQAKIYLINYSRSSMVPAPGFSSSPATGLGKMRSD